MSASAKAMAPSSADADNRRHLDARGQPVTLLLREPSRPAAAGRVGEGEGTVDGRLVHGSLEGEVAKV